MKSNDDRALCRYEYMELWVRLTMKKYNLRTNSNKIHLYLGTYYLLR